ncbi:MAG: head-tail connector protein, partial [Finegoldia magna]|nr:head-tail connector protein [Finegoldia magna]
MNLEDLKKWLRVDYNFEDSVITDLIESAKAELLLSGVPE